ncbi:hypothetical protein [Nocardia sp. NPDC051750]|uniref:hypothetical protein n=1 Tax=Nocardia sp. NPDC051750 TaxID=3364325 RepID=UPI0037BDBA16
MYPVAPADITRSSAVSERCVRAAARPMNAEPAQQPKPAGDLAIDLLLPQRR